MESSGYFGNFAREIEDDVGVYLGSCANDYNDNVASHPPNAYSSLGTLRAFLSGKISHYFGWTGPSVTYDTACSSSAVAIHAACKAIEAGECSQALAGGVSIFTNPNFYQNLAAASFLSPTGPTKPFDARADGYCRGEGVGLVVLKKFTTALADRDTILGVVTGSAVNQNSNSTAITVPHSPSQTALYSKISTLAGIDPTDVSFVEAHGTGTPVGDPIEIASIREVFGSASRTTPLHVASVKGNIGHLEGASGVAALIKTLLMMQYWTIPIQANFASLNPKIPALEPDQIVIPTSTHRWNSDFKIACINNYGAAGSNAAMIVCQAPQVQKQKALRSSRYPFYISANSVESLQRYCTAVQNLLSSSRISTKDQMASLAFNLADKHNRSLSHFVATTCSNSNDLDSQLAALRAGSIQPQSMVRAKPVVLCFGGQVSDFVGLSQESFDASTLLRSHLDSCDAAMRSLGWDGLYPDIFQKTPVEDVVKLHCMLFSLQYACAMSWIDCGLQADAVIGHSFGHLTAMSVCGVLSLKDGLSLVSGRASLMKSRWGTEHGSMVSIEAELSTVLSFISSLKASENIEIACYNGPTSHVLVGAQVIIDRLHEELSRASIKHKVLNVTHGFHSKFTEPLLAELYNVASKLSFSQPKIPLQTCTKHSNCEDLGPQHVVDHTRNSVYFGQAIERLSQSLGPSTWLEAGSNSSITAMVRHALEPSTTSSHTFQSVHLCSADSVGTLAEATANLWKAGHQVQYWPFHRSQRLEYVAMNLPSYQFEKLRHWLEWTDTATMPASIQSPKPTAEPEHALLSLTKFSGSNSRDAVFSVGLQSKEYQLYVGGHAVLAEPLCPAPLYVELVARAATMLVAEGGPADSLLPCVEDLEIKAPLGTNVDRSVNLRLSRADDQTLAWKFEMVSEENGSLKAAPSVHATGIVALEVAKSKHHTDFSRYERLVSFEKINQLRSDPDSEIMQGSTVYRVFSKVVTYADYYKGVRSIYGRGNEVAGTVKLPDDDRSIFRHHITKPIAIDNFIQVAGLHVNCLNPCEADEVFVCTKVERIQPSPKFQTSTAWMVYSSFTVTSEKQIVNDIFVFDQETKDLVLMILGAQFMKVLIRSLAKVLSRANVAEASTKVPAKIKCTKPFQALPASERIQLGPAAAKIIADSKKSTQEDAVISVDADIKKLLNRVADVSIEDLRDDATLEDLGIDSLMITEVMTEICTFFELEISAADFATLLDVKSLRTYLVARGCGHQPKPIVVDSSSGSEQGSGSVTPAHTAATSVEDLTSLVPDVAGDLAKLVEDHLESTVPMTRATILADQGLDSLLCIELASDIHKVFGVQVDMGLLDEHSAFGDLLDMVVSHNHSAAPAIPQVSASPKLAGKALAVPHLAAPPSSRPASLPRAQQAFEDIRFDYEIFTKQTGFADFWTKVYPAQARLVLAYTVEAFATLGCRLRSIQCGQRLPRVQSLPKHDLLMRQLEKILSDASLVRIDGAGLTRTDVSVDQTPSRTLFSEILRAFPHHANEHRLLHITGSKLAECLTGTADPLALLFRSKENKELLEDVYTNGPMYEAVTKLLASFLQRAYQTNREGGVFHILELGGGTGGTTKYIIDFLEKEGVHFTYTFTDLAGSLVTAAKKKFAGKDFMQFRVVDIEKQPPAEFNNKYHTIISTNCIHATRNLQLSGSNIRHMLRADGFVSLVEFTRNLFWFDLVFGLLEGWWLFEDGRQHVLASETFWDRSLRNAGFKHVTWTDGRSEEAQTLRIITAFPAGPESASFTPKTVTRKLEVETIMYRQAGSTSLYADIYLPSDITPGNKRPIALLIHGGGHVMFTRKEVDRKQIRLLHAAGFLPISVDYRFVPELNIIDGPMNDVCEALGWARFQLPELVPNLAPGLQANGEKVVAVGWSTGGHLAMTLAFTAQQRRLRAPDAILAFYCPTDYEDSWWNSPIYPEASVSAPTEAYDLLEGLQKEAIASYYPPTNTNHPGMLMSLADPRWRFVLHMNWRAQTTAFLLGQGLPYNASSPATPSRSEIASISPYAQILAGVYRSPTFLIHGRSDDLIPWQQSMRTVEALRSMGIEAGIEIIEGAKHLFDTFPAVGVDFEGQVRKGYEWLERLTK
ncbi:MAG: hypothetical protein Q9196_000686 [Gyalolechia fulgens]